MVIKQILRVDMFLSITSANIIFCFCFWLLYYSNALVHPAIQLSDKQLTKNNCDTYVMFFSFSIYGLCSYHYDIFSLILAYGIRYPLLQYCSVPPQGQGQSTVVRGYRNRIELGAYGNMGPRSRNFNTITIHKICRHNNY